MRSCHSSGKQADKLAESLDGINHLFQFIREIGLIHQLSEISQLQDISIITDGFIRQRICSSKWDKSFGQNMLIDAKKKKKIHFAEQTYTKQQQYISKPFQKREKKVLLNPHIIHVV